MRSGALVCMWCGILWCALMKGMNQSVSKFQKARKLQIAMVPAFFGVISLLVLVGIEGYIM